MKGLEPEELDAVDMVMAGFAPIIFESPVVTRLARRGVLVIGVVRCPAPLCPGHCTIEVTELGAWLRNVVRNMGRAW